MWAGFRETSGGWCNILELVTPGNCYTFRPEDLGEWPVPACQRELWLFGTASWHKLWPVKEGSSQPAMIWLANKDSEQSISYCPCPSTPASSSRWPNPTRSERQTVLMKPINAVHKSQLSEAQSRVKGGEWIWRGKKFTNIYKLEDFYIKFWISSFSHHTRWSCSPKTKSWQLVRVEHRLPCVWYRSSAVDVRSILGRKGMKKEENPGTKLIT